MKKLALALVCLVSVAFFASCDPENPIVNPEPSIATIVADGYLYDGMTVEADQMYPYGFRVASNAQTMKELSNLLITCNGETICDSTISGTEFVYRGEIEFVVNRELVGEAEILATVTDVAGKQNFASIKVDVNKEDNLVATDFSWNRHGGQAATGNLAELGLKWERNGKVDYAIIEPIAGATLYEIPAEKWNEVVTATDKAALFADGSVASIIRDYRGVSAWASGEYNDVIATLYEGKYTLIHITNGVVSTFKGTDITITGQFK